MTPAGKLRHRITLTRTTATYDADGENRETDQESVKVWAQVKAGSQAESAVNNATAARTRFDIRIRYRSDIQTSWKIDYRGQLLDIDSITDPDQMRVWLDIVAFAPRT